MTLYRSISPTELKLLIIKDKVNGNFPCSKEEQTTCNEDNVVCFFVDKNFWRDSWHNIFLEVDIPEEELVFGTGTYYAAKNFAETHIWTGRRGHVKYELKEAYSKTYSTSNVKKICVNHSLSVVDKENYLYPWIEKNNIKLVSDMFAKEEDV